MGKIIKMLSSRTKAKLHLNMMRQCPFDQETLCVDCDGKTCYRKGYCNYLELEEEQRKQPFQQ